MKEKISIIIVTYNNLEYTRDCIESIYKYTNKDTYEIIIVDNLSTDNTRDWLKTQTNLKTIYNKENLGFPKACNQGIRMANPNNHILLLNNDTIVTPNWLTNLRICLESDKKIGAVGSVCNHNENDQNCDFNYENFEIMQKLAETNNVSNPNKWEEKVFLIGFCILIKNEVIKKIGLLDEEYTPGYVEDNDLSLRILEAGYKLILCHDSFIHHYLGTAFRKDLNKFYPILYKNREYFINKWGFNTFAFDDIKASSLKIMEQPTKILELQCGIGVTLLKLKYKYPNCIIHGIEENDFKRKISKKIASVFSNISEIKDNDYDCILIGNLLEQIENPSIFLKNIRNILKDDGVIIGEIKNAASIENIEQLLNDNSYFNHQTELHQYTIEDIKKLLEKHDYQLIYTFSWYINPNNKQLNIIEKLNGIKPKNYKIVSYTFKFKKSVKKKLD